MATPTQEPAANTSTDNGILIAVLDDYTSPPFPHPVSDKYFSRLLSSNNADQPTSASPPKHKLAAYHHHPDTLNTRTPDGLAAAIERLKPYTIISTMRERTPFPPALIKSLPNLKLLLTTGMRNASIDLPACEAAGITVVGTHASPASKSLPFDTTNEQTWALILGVTKGLTADDARVKANRDGGWQRGVTTRLAGRTLGVLGLGRLGLQCAVTGKLGFGMDVVAWSENLTQDKADEAAAARGLERGSIRVAGSKEAFFRAADVLSVHYVLSGRSRGIVGARELGWMKRGAVLVNTSRGPLVDEDALVEALREERIRGVGLDVFEVEPLPRDSVWRDVSWGERVVLSPHMGYVEADTMEGWYEQQARNVGRWLSGEELEDVMSGRK